MLCLIISFIIASSKLSLRDFEASWHIKWESVVNMESCISWKRPIVLENARNSVRPAETMKL